MFPDILYNWLTEGLSAGRPLPPGRFLIAACSTNGTNRNAYEILIGKPKEIDHYEVEDVAG
jgi:hypothetical protein